MKQERHHKTIALCLAFLVLISTTGFSMNVMLCHCTGTQYLALLASENSLDCCKSKLQKAEEAAQKHDCCSSKKKHCAKKSDQEKLTIVTDKDCCSSSYKYAKANINFDLGTNLVFPSFDFFPVFAVSLAPNFDYAVEFPLSIKQIGPPNKAPPRFYGVQLLHWIQNYRC